ncbi:S8 family serine peptidase [Pedobacter sp. HMF7647]|uniref:S8 family serine peptidase n=1 Tax=Hufsiella arboris TaxID=2695275 RepID=A0A7K1YG92_9SPHI|nr:S8 family peptidase [Hufsiella arboris]MXV53198.1 S8 family serine peptidase [Hufsiella arboris]
MFKNKLLLLAVALIPILSNAQTADKPKENWQNLDLASDGVFGISTEKAYQQLLKGKKSKPVIVAVIDGGTDTNHEDLKSAIWKNPTEKPNGKDDDNNGYADDFHGWDFLGSAKGTVHYDNLEIVRQVRTLQPRYASVLNTTPLTPEESKEFKLYKKFNSEYVNKLQESQMGLLNVTAIKRYINEILAKMGKQNPTPSDFDAYVPENDMQTKALKIIKSALKKDPDFQKLQEDLNDALTYYTEQVNYNLNIDFESRDTVGDNYADKSEKLYGNNNVKGPDALHGTHVAGIIAAARDNKVGIKGIANNAQIMVVRVVPNGDERDKDVANGIRYAVDNGAKILNMSFGKSYSPDKAVVDSAVRYAVSKGALIVHAAGNDGSDNDKVGNYPNRNYVDTAGIVMGTFKNWIEVGASSWKNDEDLVATFSNYGKKSVDVFAPGVKIKSTIADNKYKDEDGTSMASPVVAGLAALVWSYYPDLSASQVKDIILKSVVKVDHKVKIKVEGATKRVDLSDICVSGGVVNAYNALQIAGQQKPL